MSFEIGSEIPNPGILQLLEIYPEAGQVLLPEGDGRIFEQGLIMRLPSPAPLGVLALRNVSKVPTMAGALVFHRLPGVSQ
jgi:hypothetical protein